MSNQKPQLGFVAWVEWFCPSCDATGKIKPPVLVPIVCVDCAVPVVLLTLERV